MTDTDTDTDTELDLPFLRAERVRLAAQIKAERSGLHWSMTMTDLANSLYGPGIETPSESTPPPARALPRSQQLAGKHFAPEPIRNGLTPGAAGAATTAGKATTAIVLNFASEQQFKHYAANGYGV